MGCSTSKLDNEESVQLCKDRTRFIKQAVEQRSRFASGHIAYIQSIRRVSDALHNYVKGDEPRDFFLDSDTIPPFTPPLKKTSQRFISVSTNSFSASSIKSETNSSFKVNYLRSGGNSSVSVEERLQSPETVRIQSYSPMHHYGMDGFFATQSSPMNSSFFYSSPNNRTNFPPSPQTSQWDFFWNPFTSLDTYGYPNRSSLEQTVMDEEIRGQKQECEEQGIPNLEEEEKEEDKKEKMIEERAKIDLNSTEEAVTIEDHAETESGTDAKQEVKGLQAHGTESIKVSETKNDVELELKNQAVADTEAKEETPGFTVYINRRKTSIAEVIKDLEAQFMVVCNSANEVSKMLEAGNAQYSSTPNELTAMRILNPVSLFHSGSSRSSPSRFFHNSSSSRDEGYDISEDSCMFSGSHQSTLDKLHAWEKKLYEEVRSGERVRIVYEKKLMQLRKLQNVEAQDTCAVDKTKAGIGDLHTQMKVSIHSVESISKRIVTLRDEELQPQLLKLIQGLARMWKVMAECHRSQKHTIDEAKLLLASTPPKLADENWRLTRSATTLETELQNWRTCFESWIVSQRSYLHALTAWLLRCIQTDPETSRLSISSRDPPIFGICIQWSRLLDATHEIPVIEGLEFFTDRVNSLNTQLLKEDSHQIPSGSKRVRVGISPEYLKVAEVGKREDEMIMIMAEKTKEVAVKVLCAGMSVTMSSLMEFAITSAEGYADLVKQWENTKLVHGKEGSTGV
ncbi:hypothetical protein HHK36_021034 [Tetracentron sinense]|uniref:DUF632 domain-containing protein n=1 Tax=Tetracentron sinense TaxID=13715 RepID=A0A834YW33_TETSI|nr:hypothetical protein HHK36_021034 [Tetracentron sinense]